MDEEIKYDIVIIGAGIAGLSCAYKLKQAEPRLTICILEKSEQVGDHIVSGAIIETKALSLLMPDWNNKLNLSYSPVTSDEIIYFKNNKLHIKMPSWAVLPSYHQNDCKSCDIKQNITGILWTPTTGGPKFID